MSSAAHPLPPPGSCSVRHELAGTSVYGTAAQATFWLALEQHGPWGRKAPTQSQLDPVLGAALEAACADAGGRLLLIRPPGRHAHRSGEPVGPRTVLLGYAGTSPWLVGGSVDDPASLIRLDWAALTAGDRAQVCRGAGWLRPVGAPMLLICTNGTRDRCCAVRSRPVALAAAARRPAQVWECSHTGGHRFAPTAVLLPTGRALARLDADLAVQALDAAADRRLPAALLGPRHDRGSSALTPPAQVAESSVRAEIGETAWAAVVSGTARGQQESSDGAPPGSDQVWQVPVRHTDGRSWQVQVSARAVGALPESCGAEPAPTRTWSAVVTQS